MKEEGEAVVMLHTHTIKKRGKKSGRK